LIGEESLPLYAHNAADKQTGSIGDIEITLKSADKVVLCYEMKDKRVTINDINHALKKVSGLEEKIDNYIFITTDIIELDVSEYAKTIYEQSGVEIAILDCLGFARHFLHFFHRHRIVFINKYQELVLNEPNSSVGQPLKEAFLILRKQAESN
jgi:DNA adenine methylase